MRTIIFLALYSLLAYGAISLMQYNKKRNDEFLAGDNGENLEPDTYRWCVKKGVIISLIKFFIGVIALPTCIIIFLNWLGKIFLFNLSSNAIIDSKHFYAAGFTGIVFALHCGVAVDLGLQRTMSTSQQNDYLKYLNKHIYTHPKMESHSANPSAFSKKAHIITASIAVIPLVLLFSPYTIVETDQVRVSTFLGLTEKVYSTEEIVSIERLTGFKAPNGRFIYEPFYEIEFSDGNTWSSKHIFGYDIDQLDKVISELSDNVSNIYRSKTDDKLSFNLPQRSIPSGITGIIYKECGKILLLQANTAT